MSTTTFGSALLDIPETAFFCLGDVAPVNDGVNPRYIGPLAPLLLRVSPSRNREYHHKPQPHPQINIRNDAAHVEFFKSACNCPIAMRCPADTGFSLLFLNVARREPTPARLLFAGFTDPHDFPL
jgi:hypothetical protein